MPAVNVSAARKASSEKRLEVRRNRRSPAVKARKGYVTVRRSDVYSQIAVMSRRKACSEAMRQLIEALDGSKKIVVKHGRKMEVESDIISITEELAQECFRKGAVRVSNMGLK